MTTLFWMVLVALVVLAAVLTGVKPRGTRLVRSTRLMAVGTVILAIILIVIAVATLGGG